MLHHLHPEELLLLGHGITFVSAILRVEVLRVLQSWHDNHVLSIGAAEVPRLPLAACALLELLGCLRRCYFRFRLLSYNLKFVPLLQTRLFQVIIEHYYSRVFFLFSTFPIL